MALIPFTPARARLSPRRDVVPLALPTTRAGLWARRTAMG